MSGLFSLKAVCLHCRFSGSVQVFVRPEENIMAAARRSQGDTRALCVKDCEMRIYSDDVTPLPDPPAVIRAGKES